ncbi:hypothetical protein VNO77_03852 [Canavalia gladiata]|uniref:Uncharacterized protein n=1 Tax=Canavalia gladiata TaxID=3824 RepID=A0AAN9MVL0_CANGL
MVVVTVWRVYDNVEKGMGVGVANPTSLMEVLGAFGYGRESSKRRKRSADELEWWRRRSMGTTAISSDGDSGGAEHKGDSEQKGKFMRIRRGKSEFERSGKYAPNKEKEIGGA